MLTPNYINNQLPKRLVSLMGEIETEMLKRVAHYLKKYGKVTGTAEFLLLKQTQYNLLYKDLLEIIARYGEKTKSTIAETFNESAVRSVEYDNRLIANAAKAGVFKPTATVATASREAMERTLKTAIQRAINIQNLTNTKCMQSALDAFTRASDKAYLSVLNGAKAFNAAYRSAVDELAENGITIVEYSRNGKTFNYTIEAATRRNLITSVNQTAAMISIQNATALGSNLVEVTSHAGARPSHAEWQGGRYWINSPVKGYGSLVDICGYGRADGLCGINCYHSFFPCFEDTPKAFDKNPARKLGIDNDKLYELNQKQRGIEREIRNAKRAADIYKSTGLTEALNKANVQVREKQAKMREFLAQNPILKRDYQREQIG